MGVEVCIADGADNLGQAVGMINHYLCFSGFFNNTMGFC
jgi:hypothetical protein